jgi:hypothetical protein
MGRAALPVRPEHQAAGSGAPVRHPRFGQADHPARLQERGELRLRPAANPLDRLSIRLGFEPRKTSVPADKIDLLAPLPDTKLRSFGIGYKISKNLDINVTGSYMTGKFYTPANTSCNMNCNTFLNIIYNPYAGQNVSGDIHVRYFGFESTSVSDLPRSTT